MDAATLAVVEAREAELEPYGPWMFQRRRRTAEPRSHRLLVALGTRQGGLDAKRRLHDLRHWSASVAIGSGHDLKTVADRLGHANAAMTLRVYAHAFAATDRAVADSVDAALEGP